MRVRLATHRKLIVIASSHFLTCVDLRLRLAKDLGFEHSNCQVHPTPLVLLLAYERNPGRGGTPEIFGWGMCHWVLRPSLCSRPSIQLHRATLF